MTDESNTETLNKEIEEELSKKVDRLLKDAIDGVVYRPSRKELSREQMIRLLEGPYTPSLLVKR